MELKNDIPVRQALPHGGRQAALRSATTLRSSMIDYSEKDGRLTFNVRVVPRASRSEIIGEHDGALRVRITAAPVDGAANQALVRLLARALDVSRSDIAITAGQTSRLKRVIISGIKPEALVMLGKISV